MRPWHNRPTRKAKLHRKFCSTRPRRCPQNVNLNVLCERVSTGPLEDPAGCNKVDTGARVQSLSFPFRLDRATQCRGTGLTRHWVAVSLHCNAHGVLVGVGLRCCDFLTPMEHGHNTTSFARRAPRGPQSFAPTHILISWAQPPRLSSLAAASSLVRALDLNPIA